MIIDMNLYHVHHTLLVCTPTLVSVSKRVVASDYCVAISQVAICGLDIRAKRRARLGRLSHEKLGYIHDSRQVATEKACALVRTAGCGERAILSVIALLRGNRV